MNSVGQGAERLAIQILGFLQEAAPLREECLAAESGLLVT